MNKVNLQGTQYLEMITHKNERVNRTLTFVTVQDGVRVPIDMEDATAVDFSIRLINASGMVLYEGTLGNGISVDGNNVVLDFTSNYKNQSGACWFTLTVTKPNWGRRTVAEGPFTVL